MTRPALAALVVAAAELTVPPRAVAFEASPLAAERPAGPEKEESALPTGLRTLVRVAADDLSAGAR